MRVRIMWSSSFGMRGSWKSMRISWRGFIRGSLKMRGFKKRIPQSWLTVFVALLSKFVLSLGPLYKWTIYFDFLNIGHLLSCSIKISIIKASYPDLGFFSCQGWILDSLSFAKNLEPKFLAKTHGCLCQQKRKITHLFLSPWYSEIRPLGWLPA